MNFGIIGYNLFSVGGTARSNLNLINELLSNQQNVYYFNYVEFGTKEVEKINRDIISTDKVHWKWVKELFEQDFALPKLDVIFITREDLFLIAEYFRYLWPDAIIVGEIHTPLSLLNEIDGLKYLSCVRIANDKIKQEFINKYGFNNVYAQTVSTRHIKWSVPEKFEATNNFVIACRFDEKQKDVMYALKIFEMLKKMGQINLHLFLKGMGPDKRKYQNYIKDHYLEEMVSFVDKLPKDYIYLSTSKFETLGYSIMEAIANAHFIVAYVGDDYSIEDIYQKFPSVFWIKKEDVSEDAQTLVESTHKTMNDSILKEDYAEFLKLTNNSDYFFKMIQNIKKYAEKTGQINVDSCNIKDIENNLTARLGPMNLGIIKKMYHYLSQNKYFGKMIQELREFLKK